MRLQAAYHMQQAIEKTIKLKAEIKGVSLWGHDIDVLIKRCIDAGINIDIPKVIEEKADMYTHWEAECRYYPIKVVRKDSIRKAYDTVFLGAEKIQVPSSAHKKRGSNRKIWSSFFFIKIMLIGLNFDIIGIYQKKFR